MKLDKTVLLAIGILVAIAAATSAYYGYDIWQESRPLEIGEDDFVEMYYIGYYENETIFASSFNETVNITIDTPFTSNDNLTALKAYLGADSPVRYPAGWTSSSLGRIAGTKVGDIPGLRDALLGLGEGDEKTIGPLPPEEAFGLPVKENITFTSDFAGVSQEFKILNISDSNLSLQWVPELGMPFTLPMFWGEEPIENPYWIWENATEVIDMNETRATILTTPNVLDNLTLYPFWEEVSNASFNETTIWVTTTPEIGNNFTYYGATYTVEDVTETTINISITYGNETYYQDVNRTYSFNRTMTLDRMFEGILQDYIQQDLLAAGYSIGEMAGETVSFRVKILSIYDL
jgi:FKBP-type peptidyl-prolyl cis-trans isomerase 2